MKKYIEPVINVIEVENSELICQSPLNNEKGDGNQLSKEMFIDDEGDDEVLW